MSTTFILHAGDTRRERVAVEMSKFLAALSDSSSWKIEISQYRRPRSCPANAYHFGVVLPTIVREKGGTSDDWHELLCGEYFGWRKAELVGKSISRPVRTTTTNDMGNRDVLDTLAFWRFVEFCRDMAAQGGVYVPGPNEC